MNQYIICVKLSYILDILSQPSMNTKSIIIFISMAASLSLLGLGTQASADQGECLTHDKSSLEGNSHCSGSDAFKSKEPIRSCGHPNSLKDNDGDVIAGCNNRP